MFLPSKGKGLKFYKSKTFSKKFYRVKAFLQLFIGPPPGFQRKGNITAFTLERAKALKL